MAESPQPLNLYLTILRRRKWHFLVPSAVIFLAALVLAFTLPPVYRSTATLLIERQEIPTDMVASTVTGYAVEQIQTISQQVMTYNNLWQIAEEFDLYPGERRPDTGYEIVNRMRESIVTEMVSEDVADPRTGKPREVAIAFSVSFDSSVPDVAKRVTERLAELYLDENRRSRTQRAVETSTFLAAEADRLNAQISELETKLANFKRENSNFLPALATVNREFLERAEQQYEETRASIRSLESRKALLQGQLEQIEGGYEERLTTLRAELTAAREKYSEIHPDVQQLKRALAALEAERKAGTNAIPVSTMSTQSRAAYMSLQSDLESVTSSLNGDRLRLASLEKDVAEYRTRVARAPEVEREYLALNRDYENAVKKYTEMKNKQMQAQLSEQLEKAQKGERLSLLEAARLPQDPIKPNRLGVALLGMMLGMMGGMGVAGIAEFRDNTVHGVRELAAILKTQPIGVIPVIEGGKVAAG